MSSKSAQGKRNREKGAQFEREITNYYRERYGREDAARRITSQAGKYSKGAGFGADVEVLGRYHVECKNRQQLNAFQAVDQAVETCRKGLLPVVMARRSGKRPIVAMPISVFDYLIERDRQLDALFAAATTGDEESIRQVLEAITVFKLSTDAAIGRQSELANLVADAEEEAEDDEE